MVEHLGEPATEAWLKGLVANLARAPKGGDTDQIRAVAAGECAAALTNSYYLARLMRSARPEDQAVVARLGVVFPNQADHGTHVNIAGGAVARHSKNVAAAVRFLEYLASPAAQAHFADGNNEWPAARGVSFDNPALKAMTGGSFKAESLPVSRVGMNQVKVQQMLDRVGFK
jgi:iron(III) transport system substrate-binding protein